MVGASNRFRIRTRRPTVVVVAFAVTLTAVGIPGVAQEPETPRRGELREAFGFAIKAPGGTGWRVNPAGDDHRVGYVRMLGKRKDQHTGVAAVAVHWIPDCSDHETCLGKAVELASAAVGGVEVTRLELSAEGVSEPTCRRMEKLEDDRRSSKKPLAVRVSGLLCTHPDEPKLVLEPAYSERYRKGRSASAGFEGARDSFVDTFEFRPIAVTVASIVDVGEASGYVESAGGSLWIHGHATVYQLDLARRRVEPRFTSPSRQYPFVYKGESIWMPYGDKPQLVRLRASDGTVQATIELSVEPYTTKQGFGSLWVTPYRKASLVRVDPASGEVVAEIPVGPGSSELAIGETSVWVSEHVSSDLIRQIDPTSNSEVKSFRPCEDPVGIDRDSRHLWVACNAPGTVLKVDPETGKTIASVNVRGDPVLVVSDDSTVWVTHYDSGTVTAVDIATMKVIAQLPLGRQMRFLKVVDGSTWVTDASHGHIYELRRVADR